MTCKPLTTPLTEPQARALAHWWGGHYKQRTVPEAGPENRHGVILTVRSALSGTASANNRIQIFSLEEAQAWENRRGFQDACSPDWVG